MRSRTIKNFIIGAFALSGATTLIYEVVWTRDLSLVLGSSTYAVSTMLTAFMAGLAVGSHYGGRWIDKTGGNPVLTFGLLELGIAAFGLVAMPLIGSLAPIYGWMFHRFQLSFSSLSIVQFAMAFAVLVIPTSLMGATFPVVVKSRVGHLNQLARGGGDAYSLNTWGAVVGSVSAGFLLLPLLGTRAANMTAVAINLSLGLVLLALFRLGRPST